MMKEPAVVTLKSSMKLAIANHSSKALMGQGWDRSCAERQRKFEALCVSVEVMDGPNVCHLLRGRKSSELEKMLD